MFVLDESDGDKSAHKADHVQGYHVQITARSDRDLTPESIVQKVSDASGSRYNGGASILPATGPTPPASSKPAFTPTHSSRGRTAFNPLSATRSATGGGKPTEVDEDGWGHDAPPVTRTQLEKVQSSYKPTKVDMRELSAQNPESPQFSATNDTRPTSRNEDVVKGGYQPVGKVDIAALRKQANQASDDRPTMVKGAYEPVGKVDIAAIRSRARQPDEGATVPNNNTNNNTFVTPSGNSHTAQPTSNLSSTSERLTSLPKPKVTGRFGPGAGSFTGTKAPSPSTFASEAKTTSPAPVGVGRTFANQSGKTPAQLWAEKKARERGLSGASDDRPPGSENSAVPLSNQKSGGEWKSGYGGKSWAPVQTTRTGQSASSLEQDRTADNDEPRDGSDPPLTGNVGAIRDRFKGEQPMGAANAGSGPAAPSPPPLDTSNKPNAGRGIPIPGLPSSTPTFQSQPAHEPESSKMPTPPPQPPRSPTPPTPPAQDSGSPIRVAMPVSRGHNDQEVENAREEQFSPPPSMPTRSLTQAIPHEDDLTEEPSGHDPARGAGEATAAVAFGDQAAKNAHPGAHEGGKRALVQYDYEKAEDNELELKEGEYVTNIEMVDEDWWMGQNSHGESGLFPSNYVELVEDDDTGDPAAQPSAAVPPSVPPPQHDEDVKDGTGATATALYDYEAAEENELTFPENAKITNVVSMKAASLLAVALTYHTRNFLMRIGGLVNTEAGKVFSLRIMCS